MTPETCCGARCRRCDVWRELERAEPPTAWCDRCDATTYRDDSGRCLACPQEISREEG